MVGWVEAQRAPPIRIRRVSGGLAAPTHPTRSSATETKKKSMAANGWISLKWDALDRWAGSRSVQRGRAYQRQGRVNDLAIADDGRLLATVPGGDRYIVSVWLNAGTTKLDKIESHCTCPVGYNCKHAVATVAAYLQALADGATTPKADADDPWRFWTSSKAAPFSKLEKARRR